MPPPDLQRFIVGRTLYLLLSHDRHCRMAARALSLLACAGTALASVALDKRGYSGSPCAQVSASSAAAVATAPHGMAT